MASSYVTMIERNSFEIRRLNERIHATFKVRDQSFANNAAWQLACAEFHQRYDQLAFPGGYAGALDRILAGDPSTVEAALCFVECRPYFFRSGYMFKDLLRRLKRTPMNAVHAKRLKMILLAYADYRHRRRRSQKRS